MKWASVLGDSKAHYQEIRRRGYTGHQTSKVTLPEV
jgi:hypothetical protein